MFKLDLEKEEETEIKLLTSVQHRKSKRLPEKNIYFCFIDYVKAFDYVDHSKLWKILQEMEIPDHLTCLLRNLYSYQKTTVGHGTMDWFQTGKGVRHSCILSPCLFNLLQSTSCKMLDCINHKLDSLQTHGLSVEFSRPEYWSE